MKQRMFSHMDLECLSSHNMGSPLNSGRPKSYGTLNKKDPKLKNYSYPQPWPSVDRTSGDAMLDFGGLEAFLGSCAMQKCKAVLVMSKSMFEIRLNQ